MNGLHAKYVLVGGGPAADAAAGAIRQRDPIGSVALVGLEPNRPYMRPALSKEYLRRQTTRPQLALRPSGWYAEHNIEMRSGRRVSVLDTARRTVTLDNGEEISFDKLLLATGASAKCLRVPGADLPNVYHLRTIEDCDRLHHAIDKARAEGRPHEFNRSARGRAAVIGSGLLAVEVAASLRQAGLQVDLVVGRSHPWAKFAGETTGRFIAHYLQSHGVLVHANAIPTRLEGDGRVQRLVTSDGQTLDCDLVVPAIGIASSRELLRGTPIAAEKAILVDERCRTSVQDIYAAGDCAAILDSLFGKHRVMDHWDSAQTMGGIAGANMAGDDVRYDTVNSFSSEVFGLTLQAWGEGRFVDHRLIRGTPNVESPDFAEIGIASDGRVAQVLAIGRQAEQQLLRELVARRFNASEREEQLKDPTTDLRSLVP